MELTDITANAYKDKLLVLVVLVVLVVVVVVVVVVIAVAVVVVWFHRLLLNQSLAISIAHFIAPAL